MSDLRNEAIEQEQPLTIEDCLSDIDEIKRDFGSFLKFAYTPGEEHSGLLLCINLENKTPHKHPVPDVIDDGSKISRLLRKLGVSFSCAVTYQTDALENGLNANCSVTLTFSQRPQQIEERLLPYLSPNLKFVEVTKIDKEDPYGPLPVAERKRVNQIFKTIARRLSAQGPSQ